MPQVVGSYPVTAFTTPINGTTTNATVVLSNDNTTRAAHVSHDADPGIHVQSSALADRPAFGSAGRKWLTSDGLRLYFDTGAAWSEIAYLPTVGGTLTGVVLFPDGTFAAPSIANTGDTDTGIYFPAADTVAVTLGTTPSLQVSGPAAGETSLWVYDADNATLERVTVGVADSGGVGFKLLRIPN